ncbi:hypothetical protein U1Q18_011861 [Sarracenia purpurea var. burkii]
MGSDSASPCMESKPEGKRVSDSLATTDLGFFFYIAFVTKPCNSRRVSVDGFLSNSRRVSFDGFTSSSRSKG